MTKPLPKLTEMPWNVKQLIVDSAETGSKYALRGCSKEFKHRVSLSPMLYPILSFQMNTDFRLAGAQLYVTGLEDIHVQYSYDKEGYTVKKLNESNAEQLIRNPNMNFIAAVVKQFEKVFQNPRVLVDRLTILVTGNHPQRYEAMKQDFNVRIQSVLTSLTNRIAVKKFNIQFNTTTQDEILQYLPYFEPGTLQDISWGMLNFNERMELTEIAELDTWKGARQLVLQSNDMRLPLDKWSHFQDTRVVVAELPIERMREVFDAFTNSPGWLYCNLRFYFIGIDRQPFIEYFTQLGATHEKLERSEKFVIRMPAPRNYAQVLISDIDVDMTKW